MRLTLPLFIVATGLPLLILSKEELVRRRRANQAIQWGGNEDTFNEAPVNEQDGTFQRHSDYENSGGYYPADTGNHPSGYDEYGKGYGSKSTKSSKGDYYGGGESRRSKALLLYKRTVA